ncbi:transketolase C-terminal domain-containing protein [Streptomyces sp. NBC_00878]|uniref:transketolase C-terminal domain-containing protein n=1 Tax=Streptomyces sp. NBC_00878 TaxID=2975854 RepID=UPI00225BFC3E|nr:transketolase C-terminal domain-containing protein [Streptomyces sp. NBC_00878]MCX4911667.1 hypothetical protein [Streptomyces sp. NBC_00878]
MYIHAVLEDGELQSGQDWKALMLMTARRLNETESSVGTANSNSLKPFDSTLVGECAVRSRLLALLKEHSVIGGLGSAVAEAVSAHSSRTRSLKMGVKDQFCRASERHQEMFGTHYAYVDNLAQQTMDRC